MKIFALVFLNIMTISTISAQSSIQLYDNGLTWVMTKFKNEATNSKGEVKNQKLPNSIVYNSIQVLSNNEIKSTQWVPKSTWKLEKLVGKNINVYTLNGESFSGIVEYTSGSSIHLRNEDKTMFIPDITKYRLEYESNSTSVGENTLLIEFEQKSKSVEYDLMFQVSGLKWEAESFIVFDSKKNAAIISVLADISNTTGSAFDNVSLTLVSSDIPSSNQRGMMRQENMMFTAQAKLNDDIEIGAEGDSYQFQFSESITISSSPLTKIPIYNNISIKAEKVYSFDATSVYEQEKSASTELVISGKERVNKIPAVPKGKVRVFERSNLNTILLADISQDRFSGTKDWNIMLGKASDVRVSQLQTKSEQLSKNVREESFDITIINDKSTDIKLLITKNVGQNWTLLNEKQGWEVESSNTLYQEVKLGAKKSKQIRLDLRFEYK